jgi:hypothetical protein
MPVAISKRSSSKQCSVDFHFTMPAAALAKSARRLTEMSDGMEVSDSGEPLDSL